LYECVFSAEKENLSRVHPWYHLLSSITTTNWGSTARPSKTDDLLWWRMHNQTEHLLHGVSRI